MSPLFCRVILLAQYMMGCAAGRIHHKVDDIQ